MSYIFGTDADFNYNETLKQRLQNSISFPTLTVSEAGFVFFHTANNKFYGWTGTAWIDFSVGGGGGGDVFLAASQTFTGTNTFTGGVVIDDVLNFIKRAGNIVNSSQGMVYFKTDNTFNISVGTGTGAHNATFAGIDSFTATRTFTLPDASGTLALEGAFVDLTTNQTIAGDKTFSGELNANTIVFTEVTSLPAQEGIGTLSSRLIFRDEQTNQPFQFNGDDLTAIHTYTLPNLTGDMTVETTGTWIPTLTDSFANWTISFTTASATYRRIGSICYFQCALTSVNSTGSSTMGGLSLGGLPFTAGRTTYNCTGLTKTSAGNSTYDSFELIINNGTTTGSFRDYQTGDTAVAGIIFVSNGVVVVEGWYFI